MESKNKAKPQNQISFSARNNHYQSMDQNLENNIDQKEFSIKNYNNYSVLKQNFLDTKLKNISINFGFPNTLNSYDYQNSFDLLENPVFEQRNYFYYDKNFKLFKNKSVSKYGDKKFNKKKILNPKLNNNRVLSPQHKIITSLKKKKCNEEQNKNINKENDIYELEVINKVLYNEDESEEKNKKTIKETISSKPEEELGSEWGEIEQAIYEEKKDPNNNLLNSVCVEIEKVNGDRQLKYVEISKDENCLDDPCLNIKYTIEDKICLNCATPAKNKNIKKQKYSTLIKNKNKNEKNILPKNLINSSWKKENVSEIHLKESKSTQNIISSSDTTEKVFFSGSTVPSTQKYSKYSHAMNNLSDLSNKEKNKTIDEIKSLNYRFKSEFKNSEITDINNINNKNSNLTEKIIGKKQKEEKDNLSPNKITNLKYNRSSYDNTSHKKTNNFLENKENINQYEQKKDTSIKKEIQEKKMYNITKIEEKSEKENEEDKQRIIKRTFIRHKNEEEEENNLFKDKSTKKEKEKDKESSVNKSQTAINLGKYEIKKEIKEKETKKFETITDKVNSSYKFKYLKIEQKKEDENRNKSEEKYIKQNKEKEEKNEKNRIEKIKKEKLAKESREKQEREKQIKLEKEKQERERLQRIEKERQERLERERKDKEKERLQKLEKERQEKERLQQIEREKQQKLEKEKKDKLERERKEKEKQEKERLQKIEREKQEKERLQKIEKERQQKIEKERKEKERLLKKTRKRKDSKIRKRKTNKA